MHNHNPYCITVSALIVAKAGAPYCSNRAGPPVYGAWITCTRGAEGWVCVRDAACDTGYAVGVMVMVMH